MFSSLFLRLSLSSLVYVGLASGGYFIYSRASSKKELKPAIVEAGNCGLEKQPPC